MRLRRRTLLAAAAALGALQMAAPARAHGGTALDASERERLLADAEAALARGDVAAASAGFERAAASDHAPDIELGIVRCHMQAGDYRRALAFASHVAGAHGSAAEGAACYAWLLHVGGQGQQAQRVLEQARARGAPAALLNAVAQRCAAPAAPASAVPLRLAPYALGAPLPAESRLVGTALLAGDGALLAPLSAVETRTRQRLWLRDGLGRSSAATVILCDATTALALLQLAEPPGGGAAFAPPLLAARDAFPGSPAFALGHAGTAAEPAWPLLQPGFVGGVVDSVPRLGIRLGRGVHRGPVFDAAGRLIGFALEAADGDRLVGASALATRFGEHFTLAPTGAAARMPVDELYERGLRWGLQLITAPA